MKSIRIGSDGLATFNGSIVAHGLGKPLSSLLCIQCVFSTSTKFRAGFERQGKQSYPSIFEQAKSKPKQPLP